MFKPTNPNELNLCFSSFFPGVTVFFSPKMPDKPFYNHSPWVDYHISCQGNPGNLLKYKQELFTDFFLCVKLSAFCRRFCCHESQ